MVDVTPFPDDLPVPDAALKLKCSACGSKRITVGMNMAEYYEALQQKTGWQAPTELKQFSPPLAGIEGQRNTTSCVLP